MTIGTRDAEGRPTVARGSGVALSQDGTCATILISEFLWPDCIANLRDNGRVAATFVRPDSYRAFQVKGHALVRAVRDDELAQARDYVLMSRAFLVSLGVPGSMVDWWLTARDVVAADCGIERAFEQTPGPRAGRAIP